VETQRLADDRGALAGLVPGRRARCPGEPVEQPRERDRRRLLRRGEQDEQGLGDVPAAALRVGAQHQAEDIVRRIRAPALDFLGEQSRERPGAS
jgi:hypothetical protein